MGPVILQHGGHWATSGDVYGCLDWESYWHWEGAGWGGCSATQSARDGPHRMTWGPDVSPAAGRPWTRDRARSLRRRAQHP